MQDDEDTLSELPKPADIRALAAHASSLSRELELAWSAALDPSALEAAQPGIEARTATYLGALMNDLRATDERLEDQGIDVRLQHWPLRAYEALAPRVTATVEERRKALLIAQVTALEGLVEAFGALSHPSGSRQDLLTGTRREWWESGALGLVRCRALLLEQVFDLIEQHDAAVAAGEEPPEAPTRETALAAVTGARLALTRGDPETAIRQSLRAVRWLLYAETGREAGQRGGRSVLENAWPTVPGGSLRPSGRDS